MWSLISLYSYNDVCQQYFELPMQISQMNLVALIWYLMLRQSPIYILMDLLSLFHLWCPQNLGGWLPSGLPPIDNCITAGWSFYFGNYQWDTASEKHIFGG